MDYDKPFVFHTSTDSGIRRDTSVWLLAGHKVCIHAKYYESYRGAPARAAVSTQHFHNGQWCDVLPYHAIDYTPESETIDGHLALAKRTIEFLDDDARGPKWSDESLRDGSF